jgi:molybdopterin-guanine dinucleotide biosynthesis protein A
MGRDKALVRWGGSDLLGHAIARLRAATGDVRILCGPVPRYLDRSVPVVTDGVADAGPLAGVLAGLAAAPSRPALVLAVDLPLVPVALLARIADLGAEADAVVPVSTRGPEPLCALYGPRCLGPIRDRVAAGELGMTSFWPDVHVRRVSAEEVACFGDPERLFRNLNTPADVDGTTPA